MCILPFTRRDFCCKISNRQYKYIEMEEFPIQSHSTRRLCAMKKRHNQHKRNSAFCIQIRKKYWLLRTMCIGSTYAGAVPFCGPSWGETGEWCVPVAEWLAEGPYEVWFLFAGAAQRIFPIPFVCLGALFLVTRDLTRSCQLLVLVRFFVSHKRYQENYTNAQLITQDSKLGTSFCKKKPCQWSAWSIGAEPQSGPTAMMYVHDSRVSNQVTNLEHELQQHRPWSLKHHECTWLPRRT
jgi:hypothetical protein